MRFLTPTDNKRLNELIGFLCIVAAILYMPRASDVPTGRRLAFNVSGPASVTAPSCTTGLACRSLRRGSDVSSAGLRGVSAARGDARYRYAVVPQPEHDSPDSHRCRLHSDCCPACPALSLWHIPGIRGAAPPGGLLGALSSSG